MALTKPPVLPAWAEAGDKVQPSNAEIQAGWPLSNVPPSRQRFNWLLHFLANGIRYLTRRGMPDYGADETYMIGDRVIGDDGKTYRSIQDDNTNHAPSASPLWWEEWAPSLSRLADLLQKQTYTAFTTAGAAPNFTLTPAPAITAYTAGQRFRVKFHAAGSGADVLNISGLGNKSLKQYDSTGAKVAAVIAASQLADVEYDGVDMVIIDPLPASTGITPPQFDNDPSLATTAFVQRALGNFAAGNSFAQDETLSVAKTGQHLLPNLTTITRVYLPSASAAGFTLGSLGEAYHIQNTASQPIAVTPQSTDSIFIYGASLGVGVALALPVGSEVTLVRISVTTWAAFGTGALRGSADFTANLSGNGYQKLPSGLIVQWGNAGNIASASSVAVTYPIAFPNGALSASATVNTTTNTATPQSAGITYTSSSQLTIRNLSASTLGFTWIAIGY